MITGHLRRGTHHAQRRISNEVIVVDAIVNQDGWATINNNASATAKSVTGTPPVSLCSSKRRFHLMPNYSSAPSPASRTCSRARSKRPRPTLRPRSPRHRAGRPSQRRKLPATSTGNRQPSRTQRFRKDELLGGPDDARYGLLGRESPAGFTVLASLPECTRSAHRCSAAGIKGGLPPRCWGRAMNQNF